MASAMIHLKAGLFFAQAFPKCDLPSFYLGCVAPDAVNLDGFAPKEVRWHAHLRAADLEEWKGNAARFLKSDESYRDPALKAGYAIHILTDVLWDEFFHEIVWEQAKALEPNAYPGTAPGWVECYRYDHSQLQEDWWTGHIRPMLEKASPCGINGLAAELLARYQSYLLADYRGNLPDGTVPEGKPRIISDGMMEQLGNRLVKEAGRRFF